MKSLLIILATVIVIASSCTSNCEKTLQVRVTHHITGEPIANIPVEVIAEEYTTFGANTTRINTRTDNNGQFEVSSKEDVSRWSYDIEYDDVRIHSKTSDEKLGSAPCGDHIEEITMLGLADVELTAIEDLDIFAYKLRYLSEFNIPNGQGIIKIGETANFSILESIPNEIKLTYFNYVDEIVKEETIILEVDRGELKKIEIGI